LRMSERKFLILVEKPRSSPQKFYKVHVSLEELEDFWKWWREIKEKRQKC